MKIAHLADLHAGFRQFDRTDARGRNQRETDVELAIRAAIDGVIAARPDVVVVAGDLFHSFRPPNSAVVFLFGEFKRLKAALPDVEVIIAAGNHDTPKTIETGDILPLLEAAGARVAMRQPLEVPIPGGRVLAVPSWVADKGGAMPPPPAGEGKKILVVHGDVPGFGAPEGALDKYLDVDHLKAAGWDYVALGHYHCAAAIAPHIWYAGSVEFTDSNPWAEINGGPKGWLLVELGEGRPAIAHQAVPTRRFIDVPPFLATGLTAEQLNARLADRFAEFDVTDAVVRLKVFDVAREVSRALDHARIRQWKASALNLHLQLERPDHEKSTQASRARVFKKIDDTVRDFLGSRELPPGMDRGAFVETGMKYLQETDPEA